MKIGCRLVAGFPPQQRVSAQVKSCEIYGGECGIRARFLRVLRFPLPLISTVPLYSPPGAGTIGKIMADVPSGPNLTKAQNRYRHGGGSNISAAS
jgi:hypothetical protein